MKMRRKVSSGKTVGSKPVTTSLLHMADNMVRQHSIGRIVYNLSDVKGWHSHQILYWFCHRRINP